MINLENYEAYFLDYIEGNLSQKDIDMLLLFLDEHPNLKNELESFGDISLSPTPINFNKSTLKQVDLINDNINTENFEDFAIANFENELDNEKELELKSFISKNPEFEKEAFLISKTKLKADLKIKHPDKSELKKSLPLFIPLLKYGSVAAILLLMIYFFIPKNEKNQKFVAVKTTTENISDNNIKKEVLENSQNKEVENSNLDNIKLTNYNSTIDNNHSSNVEIQNNAELINKVKDENPAKSVNDYINSVERLSNELLPSKSETRLVASALDVRDVKPYYEEINNSTITASKEDDFLTPKEFLTSLFKKKVLKSDNDRPELEIDDFKNALASATNEKMSLKKASNEARYLSINTKNFSFEKKISD